MKKIIVLLMVLILAFAVVIPVSAGGGNGGGNGGGGNGSGGSTGSGGDQVRQGPPGTFAITGTIASIGTNTVTIDVVRGNKLAQPYFGIRIPVTVTSRTRYVLRDSTTTNITITDLKVGQPVSVNGTVANNIWTASRITVGASLSCLP
jgi:hypothetical protein